MRWTPSRVLTPALLAGLVMVTVACTRSDERAPGASTGKSVDESAGSTPAVDAGQSGADDTGGEPAAKTAACVVPWGDPKPAATAAESCPAPPEDGPDLEHGRVTFLDAPDRPRITVEVALDAASRSRGLMYRTSLPESEGMLFSWPSPAPRSFWMKNTCIPLDMLFVDEKGFIAGIQEQVPVLNLVSRAVPCPATHVIEVNAGWCREHGVAPGQRVKIEAPAP